MTEDAFEVEVECEGERAGAPSPARFRLGARVVGTREIVDCWPGAGHVYFKLLGSDGATYILRHDEAAGRWRLVLFDRGPGRAGPPS
ncbi:MAG TPA: hypothetical protein VFG43_12070 [Geminicoccaceae bacterium]|nr:hypothetical protein [Geminicoccaceae bacterium]